MYSIRLIGSTTLLMKNVQLGDPDNEFVREINRLNALKTKITEEQRAERDYLKWRGAMYYVDGMGPVMPTANIFRSLQQAAALTRQGKTIERGVILHGTEVPLEYSGPRDTESLWAGGKGAHVDRRMAKVNNAPVVNVRPAFPQWECEANFDLDEDVLSISDFEWIAERAGRLIHIGDYRRFFGAYTVEVSK